MFLKYIFFLYIYTVHNYVVNNVISTGFLTISNYVISRQDHPSGSEIESKVIGFESKSYQWLTVIHLSNT